MREEISNVYELLKGRYGRRRITDDLNDDRAKPFCRPSGASNEGARRNGLSAQELQEDDRP